MQPSFLDTGTQRLGYLKQQGSGPAVMFLTGFKSDMTGSKAEALARYCSERGQAFLRFDYSGHGSSSGKFAEGTIGEWKRDALAVFDQLTRGPVILVGSSMGAWLALLIALERKERVQALVGIASAPDFTERLIWEKINEAQKKDLLENGVFYAPSCYGEDPYPITLKLIEEARAHLLLDKDIPLTCPVHLLHGTMDEDVPLIIPELLREKIPHAALTLIEGSNHRLSTPADLTLICEAIGGIIK